jgi:cob(I)alamin adenosyltransferase
VVLGNRTTSRGRAPTFYTPPAGHGKTVCFRLQSARETMPIYTKTGDQGKTSLFSGERIAKSDLRLACYGAVDELNSVLGLIRSHLPEEAQQTGEDLMQIQSHLFAVGSWLATSEGSSPVSERRTVPPANVDFLEKSIDRMTSALPPLKQFILPGGHPSAGWSHLARTVCRRAERHCVALLEKMESDDIPEPHKLLLIYLNRLSDYLFVLARYCNHRIGIKDTTWTPE